ncbi:hypothetical protein DFH06DRAFT_1374796 [Mycena polygramma]|nr:hypothetical protein DFH06DRAFT_1374796 [Mycena polygramma]
MSDSEEAELNETYGHFLSTKSEDFERDTFVFVSLPQKAQLYLGWNQKITPVTSSALHRWVKLMSGVYSTDDASDEFFLCPVTMSSVGIMAYDIHPSGPSIEPYSAEPIPPGNYGLYFDRECTISGGLNLSMVQPRWTNFAKLLSKHWSKESRAVLDLISPELEDSVVARDVGRCRFTGMNDNTVSAWIIPRRYLWRLTSDFGGEQDWDTTPFFNVDNILTMHKSLVRDFLRSYFTVDVDDSYRIVLLHPDGDKRHILPTHLPGREYNAAADYFLRLHCRFSLDHALRGGDISDDYSNWTIMGAMNELGVDYYGNEDPDVEMAPLSDKRWQTALGKVILRHVLERRTAELQPEEDTSDLAELLAIVRKCDPNWNPGFCLPGVETSEEEEEKE